MSLLDCLSDHAVWTAFYEYKTDKAHFSKKEVLFFDDFIGEKRYKEICSGLSSREYRFSIPKKKLINKLGTEKKRVVYSFTEEENAVLKLLAFLLYKYDGEMCDNCYSFRRSTGAKTAVKRLTSDKNIGEMYSYKLDISNYFNSIDAALLLPELKKLFADDDKLYELFEELLTEDKAEFEGEIIAENRGVMAGTPVSPFLANVFLIPLDRYFEENNILYARYSDDIIVFANTESELFELRDYILGALESRRLSVNEKKVRYTAPHEKWEYLGVEYSDGTVDIARSSIDKLKGKIRRKARSLYRWKLRKEADGERAIAAFSRTFNKKFFGRECDDEFTWARWFFPLINTDRGLREIDLYLQENMRYIVTGKHNGANFRTRYETLKSCGYRSLVNEYYKFIKESRDGADK